MIIPGQKLQELRRIRIIAKNYSLLRGLQGVPFGLLSLLVAAFELRWLSLPDPWINAALFAGIIMFFVSLAAYSMIGKYYDKMFGSVQHIPRNTLDRIISSLGFAVLVTGGIRIDTTLNLSISATGIAFAFCILICWWQTNAFRTHLLVLAFVLFFCSLLPLTGFSAFQKLFIPGHGGYELIYGVILTGGGLCDHFLLIHAFRQTQRAYYDKAI